MAMLAPPLVEGTIPAFYSNDQGIVITIPYSMNRVVSMVNIKGFQVKIKTIQSSTQIYSCEVLKNNNDNNVVRLTIPSSEQTLFKVGQFYKFQIAYIDIKTGEIGHYSSVAVGKYTHQPEVSILNLDHTVLNSHSYSYTGQYKIEDSTERVYSYRFDLYNDENKLISTSGDLLHSSSDDDTLGLSVDSYTFSQDLETGKTHKVKYTVITNNRMEVSSPPYRVVQKHSISPEIDATLSATLNYENGYIDIRLHGGPTDIFSGSFIIARACSDTNYTVWEEVYRFSLMAQLASRHLCKDFTIEQGKKYVYGLQQYNSNNLRSNRILSNTVYADFEDAFLYDGKRQLKIKYNPKVSSFKKDLLEQKTDTIGGKYPFIFRNGRVNYSEFPISGLISYQMDEENLFLSEKEYGLAEKTTNLTGENIAAERAFKMKVLEWLTNGEPKVFRSPSEGNFIVRLMNSSLSPNDTVGRMLHTFSSTAYEIADYNYSTLGEMGFITISDTHTYALQWETVEFAKTNNGSVEYAPTGENLLTHARARTLRLDNMTPGDIVDIELDGKGFEAIAIGVTGSYYIDMGVDILQIKLRAKSAGSMTFSYDYYKEPAFNTISNVVVTEVPQRGFIGEHDILQEILYVYDDENNTWVKNPKVDVLEIYSIDAERRPVQRHPEDTMINIGGDPFLLLETGELKIETGVSPGRPKETFIRSSYYDAYNGKEYGPDEYEPYIVLNGTSISIEDSENVSYLKPGRITELKSGNGVLVNLSYQLGIITYQVETEAFTSKVNKGHYLYALREAIQKYNTAVQGLQTALSSKSGSDKTYADNIDAARVKVDDTYITYILELVKAQEEDARIRGEALKDE